MIGSAKGVVVKTFDDYTDGDAISKLNKFIQENPDITIIDIKYFNGYSVIENNDFDSYGRENALLIYRKPVDTYESFFSTLESKGFIVDKTKK